MGGTLGKNFKWESNTWPTLIIKVDMDIGLTSN